MKWLCLLEEGLFDYANPSILLCSKDLEEALNMKAFHMTETRDLVLSHITKISDQGLRDKFRNQKINHFRGNDMDVSRTKLNNEIPQNSPPAVPRIIRTANISTALFTDKNAKFTLKPNSKGCPLCSR